jgi:hypothetical protein
MARVKAKARTRRLHGGIAERVSVGVGSAALAGDGGAYVIRRSAVEDRRWRRGSQGLGVVVDVGRMVVEEKTRGKGSSLRATARSIRSEGGMLRDRACWTLQVEEKHFP